MQGITNVLKSWLMEHYQLPSCGEWRTPVFLSLHQACFHYGAKANPTSSNGDLPTGKCWLCGVMWLPLGYGVSILLQMMLASC